MNFSTKTLTYLTGDVVVTEAATPVTPVIPLEKASSVGSLARVISIAPGE